MDHLSLRNTARALLGIKKAADSQEDDDWMQDHIRRARCPTCREWRADVPLELPGVEIIEPPRQPLDTLGLVLLVDVRLLALLEPLPPGVCTGPVFVGPSRTLLQTHRGLVGRGEMLLESHRGRYARHSSCPDCGSIRSFRVGWAHPVVVARSLSDRDYHITALLDIFLVPGSQTHKRVIEHFPKLRLFRVPVVDEPLDGILLPGDPGWNGQVVRLPLPVPPTHEPEPGTGAWL